MSETNQAFEFEYVNLNEIDPTLKPVPAASYKQRLVKTSVINGIGKNSGKPYTRFEVQTQIIDHPQQGGRAVFGSLFPSGQKEMRFLRRLMDATGVVQSEGEPLGEWFGRLATDKPEFQGVVGVESYTTSTGESKEKNTIDFGSIVAA